MLRTLSVISGARVVSTAAQAATLLVLARRLGPPEFGQFAAVLGGLMALGIVADGGATYAVGRHHITPGTVVQILRAGRLLSTATLLVSVPALAVLAVLADLSDPAVQAACVLMCAWVPLERQSEVNSAYLLARGREGVVGAAYLLRRLPTLAAVLLVPAAVSPLLAFAAAMVGTAAVAVVVLGRRVTEETAEVRARRSGARLRDALIPHRTVWTLLRPFWVAVAGQGVRQIDVAVLGMTAGPTAAGVFAPASRLVPALLLVPGTYTQLLLGRLSAGQDRRRRRRKAPALAGVALASAAAFLPLAVFADLWVPLLLGDAYLASVDVIRVVTVSLCFATLSSVVAAALHAADRAASVATAVWIGATTTIGLVAVLGAGYGALGAAWAVAAGYLLQFVLMAAFHHHHHHRVGRATPRRTAAPLAGR